MLNGRGTNQRVVHRSAGHFELAKPGQQLGGSVVSEKTSDGKVLRDQTADHTRTPARGRRQPSQDRERLEGRMAGEAEGLVANRVDDGTMMLVVGDNERNGDACIDQ